MNINNYFDKIYLLNLHKRRDRLNKSTQKLDLLNLHYDVFNGTDGSVITKLWEKLENPNFSNTNYLGCAISHLSIYQDALHNEYEKILIIEDDNLINKDIWNILKIAPIGKWIKFIHASVDRIPSVKNDIYMMKLIKKYDDDFVNEVMKTLNESNRILNNIIEFYNSVCLDNKDELIIFDI